MPERNITFEIKEHLGVIARRDSNWNRELNLISWNGAPAKYDIRDWDEFHEKMSRGITLSQWEMRKMVDLYVSRNNERAIARGRAIQAERNARKDAAFRAKDAELNVTSDESSVEETAADTSPCAESEAKTSAETCDLPFDPETGEVKEESFQDMNEM